LVDAVWAMANAGAISDSEIAIAMAGKRGVTRTARGTAVRMRLISNTERLSSSGVNLTRRAR